MVFSSRINENTNQGATVITDDILSHKNLKGYENKIVSLLLVNTVCNKLHTNGIKKFGIIKKKIM